MKSYYLQFGSGDPRTFTGLAPTFLIYKLADGTNVTPPAITEVSASGLYTFSWGTTTSIAFLADAATTSPGSSNRYIAGSLDPADRIDEVGTTLVAIGTSLTAGQVNFGSTLVAIGNTSIAYGGTLSQVLTNTGSTLVAIGNTGIALGTTGVALGTTSVALGTSNIALGNSSVALGTSMVALGTSIYALEISIAASLINLGALIGTTASIIGDSSTAPADLFGYLKRSRDVLEGQEKFVKGTGAFTIFDRTGATTLSTRTITNNSSLVVKA